MDEARKRELQEAYKNYRPDMGVFGIRHRDTGKIYVEETVNLKGKINSSVFQLNMNTFMLNRTLNADWKHFGKDAFEVVILEKLEYDEDDPGNKDYKKTLENLCDAWKSRLDLEGTALY